MSASDAQIRDLAKLEEILQWAGIVRELSNSPRWKHCIADGSIIEEHSDACDTVWLGLDQFLDVRAARGNPVSPIIPPPDYRKQVKQLLRAALRKQLLSIVQDALDQIVDEIEL